MGFGIGLALGLTLGGAAAGSAELVPAGNWTALSLAILSNQSRDGFRIQTAADDAFGMAQKSLTTFVIGATYRVQATVDIVSADTTATLRVGTATINNAGSLIDDAKTADGSWDLEFVADAETLFFGVAISRAAFSADATVSGFSITKVADPVVIDAPTDLVYVEDSDPPAFTMNVTTSGPGTVQLGDEPVKRYNGNDLETYVGDPIASWPPGFFEGFGDAALGNGATGYVQYAIRRGSIQSDWSVNAAYSIGDVVDPVFTSPTTGSVEEGDTLSFNVTTDEATTKTIVGGAQSADFEIVTGATPATTHVLRWASNGTETPGSFEVIIEAEDAYGNTAQQTITITCTAAFAEVGVTFDGTNDYLRRLTDFTGIADGRTGLFFFSFQFDSVAGATSEMLMTGGNYTSFFCQRRTSANGSQMQFNAYNTSGAAVITMTGSAVAIGAERTNVLVSVNADGTSRLYVWKAGTWTQDGSDAAGGAADLNWASGGAGIGAQFDSGNKAGGIFYRAAAWFNPASLPDITDAAVRNLFCDPTTGALKDPALSVAAIGAPQIDFYGDAATWNAGTNSGSAEDMTMVGAVT